MNTIAPTPGKMHWLIQSGLMKIEVLQQLNQDAKSSDSPLLSHIIEKGLVDAPVIAKTASQHFRLPLIDLDSVDPSQLPAFGQTQSLIKKHRVLPLAKNGQTITLARSDPADEIGLADMQFMTGCRPVLVVVEDHKLDRYIQEWVPGCASELPDLSLLEPRGTEFDVSGNSPDCEDTANSLLLDSPVMNYVNKLLIDAVRQEVSDIHIESFEQFSRIRFRQDGLLREIARPPVSVGKKFISRLKIMGKLDIAEKRLPQDGRFKVKLTTGKTTDFRLSTLPALWGEKAVLRIQDLSPMQFDLEALGFNSEQKVLFLEALDKQHGLILVTGPTGSGKSMSLYAGLNHLNTPERNISTVEDPVEIHLEGVNQVSINQSIGLSFAEILRTFLRQDPDILMVGEIRDEETADIALWQHKPAIWSSRHFIQTMPRILSPDYWIWVSRH